MARKSPKCPPTVEPSQFGCVWNFSGMFDPQHRPNRKMLAGISHGSKSLPGAEHSRSEVRVVSFDDQLRSINIESKKKSVKRSVEGETSSSKQTRKNDTVEESFWKKIKSRYENSNKKKKNPSFVDRIVVLKPVQHAIECPVDVGCRFSYLQPNPSSINKQPIVKTPHFSFNDVTKKLKNAKKQKNTRKTKSCGDFEGGNESKPEKLSIVSFSKQREPEVFVEARRHLAERLRLVSKGEGESSQQVARPLERILLWSPVHGSMAAFSGSSLSNQNEDSSDGGDSKFLNPGSDPNEIGAPGGSQPGFSLDVSLPKSDRICKSETIDNDQFRENPSPVSVLESFFADNLSSPTSTIESVEHQIQPHRLDFEEHSSQTSSPPNQKTSLNTFIEDREAISAYIIAIYEGSCSNWDDFLLTDYPFESLCDHKLLLDCVEEVLVGLRSNIITFVDSKIRRFSLEKDVIDEVMEQVDWHNGQPVVPRTLDRLVGRDIAKSGKWVDVKSNGNDIVFEVVDDTLQELIVETIFEILV